MDVDSDMEKSLIEKVREHGILYNKGLADHRNLLARQIAWEKIGKDLKIPANDAKEYWGTIRRRFCNARNKRRLYGGGPFKTESLGKYERLSFLVPFVEKKEPIERASRHVSESQSSGTLENDTLENVTVEYDTLENDIVENEIMVDETSSVQSDSQSEADVSEEEENITPQSSRGQLHQVVEILKQNAALLKREYEQQNMRPESLLDNLDKTDLFFLSMSRMTKQLPKFEQTQIKLALSNSVLSAEQRFFEGSTSSTADRGQNAPSNLQQPLQTHLNIRPRMTLIKKLPITHK